MHSPLLRKHNRRPLILGHRGARAFEPENTIAAFARAVADGADGVELDVRMTSDGTLVLSHDDELKGSALQGRHLISRLTWTQIQYLSECGGPQLPTLRDALHFQAETGCWMNVELKGDVPAPGYMAHEAAREIGIHGGDHIVVSSFSPFLVWTMARLLPHVPTAWLLDRDQRWTKRVLPLRLLGAQGAHAEATLLDDTFVGRLRDKDAFIGSFTINDVDQAQRLSALGVDVLIGDDPGALLRALS